MADTAASSILGLAEPRLIPKFCRKCGRELHLVVEREDGFDTTTGEPTSFVVHTEVRCPKIKRIYKAKGHTRWFRGILSDRWYEAW